MPVGANILLESGKPLCFKVGNAQAVGIAPPPLRLGDALRTWVRSLSVFQKEAIVTSARTGAAWRIACDEGPYLDGHDVAPCPLAYLTAGMIASYMTEITALAAQKGVRIRNLRLVQDNYYLSRGSMMKRTMLGGALPVELMVEIDCDLDMDGAHALVVDAVHASPLNGLMRGQLESLFALSRNGSEIALGRAKRLEGAMLPDPGDRFELAAALPSEVADALIARGEPTRRKPGDRAPVAVGSSLADEQDRILNIGGIGTLREDGIKEIVHLQYAPNGTSFRILSEEAPANGGLGRAPDANSLISAGFGFCFMTQFGRFTKAVKLQLSDYRIIQDSHFSLGGASGGTGRAGEALALETHCHLTTQESEDAAREMLDMSEQTCFLHAFCRTDLKSKLSVRRLQPPARQDIEI